LFHDLPLSKYLQKRLGYAKRKKKRRKGRYARKNDIKKEEEIAHVSNISKREEKIMHKGV
jgi:hypothetical protein